MAEYVCSHCGTDIDRTYGVRYIVRTCASCGRHGRLVNGELIDTLETVPPEDRPEDWDEMALDERLLHALEEGLLDLGDLQVS